MAQVICAYCKRVMDDDFPGEHDSHGICPTYLAAELKRLEKEEPSG